MNFNADNARAATALAKFRRENQGALDLLETRIRGAAAAGSLQVIVDLQGNHYSAKSVSAIAELVRDQGYAVRVDEQGVEPNRLFRFTISWN